MPSYWLTRFLLLRLLGLVYLVAFLVAANQATPLFGHDGLTPAPPRLDATAAELGGRGAGFLALPSVFWLDASDGAMRGVAWTGVALSAVVLAGFANAVLLLVLWALYMSFVHVGGLWYGYGWEIQLLETGVLGAFLCPLLDPRPFPRRPPPVAVIWLHRWLVFRIMLGAGLIKLRGDPCWRQLTCLYWHYETQPIPNPLSRGFHFLPRTAHRAGVLYNHLAELVAPFGAFGPRRVRHVAGAVMLLFQLILVASGNLSFLNYLTIVPILSCFDDGLLARVLPQALVARADRARAAAMASRGQQAAVAALVVVVVVLSRAPVANLLSTRQVMNTSFDPLHLVNTYGAFGTVGRERDEVVFEGTRDARPTADAAWRPYEFRCKPGDPRRTPCVVSPYHLRLDWQIWFAAMTTADRYPWTVHFVWKLLHADPGVLGLLAGNPFPEGPPRWVRARLWRYRFAPPGNPQGLWWDRELLGDWLPALSADDPRLLAFLARHGWGPTAR
jgi:hypothetical protein